MTHKEGDPCPVCHGTGDRLMQRDAHRSEGIVPCGFSTIRPGTFKGRPVNYIGLRCHSGVLKK